jgi:hypothetical protein
VGNQPVAIAVADFNRHGNLDLAVVNQRSNTVSILLGNGDGTFQPPRTIRVGNDPVAITVGDFNRDGNPDLAVALHGFTRACISRARWEQPELAEETFAGRRPSVLMLNRGADAACEETAAAGSSVAILLGTGNGTFQMARILGVGTRPTSLTVGHFNRVGNDDLVVTNFNADSVTVLLGSGDGTFQAGRTLPVGLRPSSVIVADFDGDGNEDLAVANRGSNTVAILLGDGEGGFQLAQELGVEIGPGAVVAADFDRDGLQGLATANQSSDDVSILRGNRCAECWQAARQADAPVTTLASRSTHSESAGGPGPSRKGTKK